MQWARREVVRAPRPRRPRRPRRNRLSLPHERPPQRLLPFFRFLLTNFVSSRLILLSPSLFSLSFSVLKELDIYKLLSAFREQIVILIFFYAHAHISFNDSFRFLNIKKKIYLFD